MLSILPDSIEEDVSSDSSECTSGLEVQSDTRLSKLGRNVEVALAFGEGPSERSSTPRVSADLSSNSTVKDSIPARVAGHSTWSKEQQVKKFIDLHEKRVQAAQEVIPEGCRRRRRRKRRNRDTTGDDHDIPRKRMQGSHDGHPSKSDDPLQSRSSEVKQDGLSKTEQAQEHWDTLKGYLDVNSHISQGVDHGKYAPDKSGLEKRLDEAVAEGDFERAEQLSEELSIRDLGCRIAKAADARDYMKWKTEREEEKAAKKRKKKKKLAWGFEVKNRWEMKANM